VVDLLKGVGRLFKEGGSPRERKITKNPTIVFLLKFMVENDSTQFSCQVK